MAEIKGSGREGGERSGQPENWNESDRSYYVAPFVNTMNSLPVSLSCLSQFKLCNLSCALHGGGGGGSALIRGICLYCVNILDIVTDYCK